MSLPKKNAAQPECECQASHSKAGEINLDNVFSCFTSSFRVVTCSQAKDKHLKYVGECNFFSYQTIKCILKQVSGWYDDECYMQNGKSRGFGREKAKQN